MSLGSSHGVLSVIFGFFGFFWHFEITLPRVTNVKTTSRLVFLKVLPTQAILEATNFQLLVRFVVILGKYQQLSQTLQYEFFAVVFRVFRRIAWCSEYDFWILGEVLDRHRSPEKKRR